MKALDLFAGCGGFGLGAMLAGIDVIWANEIDPVACATYRKNVGNHLVEGDIYDIPLDEIPDADLVMGGPPCQGFSQAGTMDPTDERNLLIWKFAEIVEAKRPKAFVLENVSSLVRLKRFALIKDHILNLFRGMGYSTEALLLKASDYGVPQARQRVFLCGR